VQITIDDRVNIWERKWQVIIRFMKKINIRLKYRNTSYNSVHKTSVFQAPLSKIPYTKN